MEDELLDNGIAEVKPKFNYPFYLFVVGFLNIALTIVLYTSTSSLVSSRNDLMRVLTSESYIAFIQAGTWVLLLLILDSAQAFLKVKTKAEWIQWVGNIVVWWLSSFVVIFFVTLLILIPRIIFLGAVFLIGSLLITNFEIEGIALSALYLLFTIVVTTGWLCYYSKNQRTES